MPVAMTMVFKLSSNHADSLKSVSDPVEACDCIKGAIFGAKLQNASLKSYRTSLATQNTGINQQPAAGSAGESSLPERPPFSFSDRIRRRFGRERFYDRLQQI